MQTPQTIVILGGGKAGRGIAHALSGSHDRVLICEEQFGEAEQFASGLKESHPSFDVEAVQCSYDAVWEADIIILTLPCSQAAETLKKIGPVANQKVLITVDSAVEEMQPLLPNTKMVQAFDSMDEGAFYCKEREKGSVPCTVSGANSEAVQTVAELVRSIGFNPVIRSAPPC